MEERNHALDSAKGVLIYLVVFAHLLEVTNYWGAATTVHFPLTAIYLFHMPAFILLAGVTAKPTGLFRRIATILIWLVTFSLLYYFIGNAIGQHSKVSNYFPAWILWFLLALAFWQLSTPLVRRFPAWSIVGSVVIALAAGTIDDLGNPFAASRTLTFLPWFVVGAAYGNAILRVAARTGRLVKCVCVVLSAGAILGVYWWDLSPWWFFGNRSYEGLDVGDGLGFLVRAAIMLVSGLLTFTVLTLVPDRDGLVAAAGKRSLAVYLFHGAIVMVLAPAMPMVLSAYGGLPAVLTCALLAVVIVAVFSMPWFDRFLRFYTDALTGRKRRRSIAVTSEAESGRHMNSGPNEGEMS